MADEQNPAPKRRRDTILPERLMRRVLEGVGDAVDRKLGRTVDPKTGLTTDQLISRMNRMIDERVRNEKGQGRIAPHHLKLKLEWGTHSETPPEGSRELPLTFVAGGRRLNVGRGTDNDLYFNHSSVSKVHAAVRMDLSGDLLVADTGSTNGTHINGVRIPYGEARPIAEGDV